MKRARTSGAEEREPAARRITALRCAAVAALLAALWLFDLYVLRTSVLTPFVGPHGKVPALTPIYAFWSPLVSPRVITFALLAAGFVLAAERLSCPKRTRARTFVAAAVAIAVALPLALFVTRQPLGELGTQFLIYPNEEVYFDALRITDLSAFLARYVELMPTLSLHGKHFPPGHATLLYVVGQCFGTSPLVAGIAVLACFALAVPFVYLALARMHGDVAARQGVLLLLAAPSVLDFACTSMDAAFLLPAAISLWLAARAIEPTRRFVDPALTGVALFVATCFSFSTFPLGLAIGLAILIAGRKSVPRAVGSVALVGAGYAASALATYAATGFPIWACLVEAKQSNFEFMSRVVGRYAHDLYGHLCYGNAAGVLIGSGAGLVAAAFAARAFWRDPWSLAFVLTFTVMVLGGIYFMETERIWLFAMPWLAAIAVSKGPFDGASLRIALGFGLVQALLMETLLFTLW